MTNRIAIVTDSNSGITREQAKELGISVVPMPFLIDGEIYFEDISLTREEFFKRQDADEDITTSQPSSGDVLELWDGLLEDYDEIVHIPMSSGLSSSTETAIMLSDDYDGRVQVVDNQRISVTQRQSVLDAIALREKGMNAAQIKDVLEREKYQSSIYIMLDTLKHLKKGGRITPAAAAIGTALKLKPVLQIQGEKLDAFAIARSRKQAISKMIAAMKNDIENRFGGMENLDHIYLEIAHTQNVEGVEELKTEMEKVFPGKDIYVDHLSLSVSCHIGRGSLAMACSKMLPELEK